VTPKCGTWKKFKVFGVWDLEKFGVCMAVDIKFLKGLCFMCTRNGKVCDCDRDSVPHAGIMRWVYRDSFLVGPGPAYARRLAEGLTGREGSDAYE
jgi:hypothetical protein